MKLVVVTLVIIIICNLSFIESESPPNNNIANLFKCKLCSEMIDVDFNYDHIIDYHDKLTKIKNYMISDLELEEDKINEQLSKDNLEFLTKEISMQ